jgi:hypothetical protein
MANDSSFQRRADAGGEVGPNGEFYKGGQFIANSEDTVKGGSMRWEPRPKAEWEIQRDAEIAARVARQAAWLAARAVEFADLLAVLESEPRGHFDTLWQSLARSLRQYGSLSPKQAEYAVKAIIGRRKKANADEWDALWEQLRKEFV